MKYKNIAHPGFFFFFRKAFSQEWFRILIENVYDNRHFILRDLE